MRHNFKSEVDTDRTPFFGPLYVRVTGSVFV